MTAPIQTISSINIKRKRQPKKKRKRRRIVRLFIKFAAWKIGRRQELMKKSSNRAMQQLQSRCPPMGLPIQIVKWSSIIWTNPNVMTRFLTSRAVHVAVLVGKSGTSSGRSAGFQPQVDLSLPNPIHVICYHRNVIPYKSIAPAQKYQLEPNRNRVNEKKRNKWK